MSQVLSWNLQLAVREGQLEALKSLMEEMVESTLNEPGTLIYEWYLSDDGTACHLYERYRDNEAAMVHMDSFGANFAERFLGCLEPVSFHVYGNPVEEIRAGLGGFGARFLGLLGGFAR